MNCIYGEQSRTIYPERSRRACGERLVLSEVEGSRTIYGERRRTIYPERSRRACGERLVLSEVEGSRTIYGERLVLPVLRYRRKRSRRTRPEGSS